MFLNNPIFSQEFCFPIYAKNKAEAFKKATGVINRKTNVDVQNKEFIEFDFNPQKFDTHYKIEEYVKQLLKTKELNSNSYPIGYFKTNIRGIAGYEIDGVDVKHADRKLLKFKTVYHVRTGPFEQNHRLYEFCSTKKEAISLAKQHVSQYHTEVNIEKKMILESGESGMLIATVTPKKKERYNKDYLYYFFGIDEVNRKKYM